MKFVRSAVVMLFATLGPLAQHVRGDDNCTMICEASFEDSFDYIETLQDYVFDVLNSTFVAAEDDIESLIEDTYESAISQLEQKAQAIKKTQTQLDSTHEALVELMSSSVEASGKATKTMNVNVGVSWGALTINALVAFIVGVAVEGVRLRSSRFLNGKDDPQQKPLQQQIIADES